MGVVRTFNAYLGGGSALEELEISYSGEFIWRYDKYGGSWYREYILVESGVLTLEKAYQADIYLVGAGGMGAASPSSSSYAYPSPGGGSGYPECALAVMINPGEWPVIIGANDNQATLIFGLTANNGGDAAAAASSSSVGEGYTDTYHLYNDTNYPAGTGGGASRGSGTPKQTVPGIGGGGLVLPNFPLVLPDWGMSRTTASLNGTPIKPTYSGFGAGAMGALSAYTNGTNVYAALNPKPAGGVVLIRVAV
ncbi:hypothetical protein FACS18948_6530 [Clostridia bacterium]|nr:hypothetical protein FACS18948_6530 [Clostridia bacterium]